MPMFTLSPEDLNELAQELREARTPEQIESVIVTLDRVVPLLQSALREIKANEYLDAFDVELLLHVHTQSLEIARAAA